MKCGFCKASCPVHTGSERTSPRARVRLARAYDSGEIGFSEPLKSEMGVCINCKSCAAECPSGVAVDRIILEMRRRIVAREGLHPAKRLIFRNLLSNPDRLRFWARTLGILTRASGMNSPHHPLRLILPLLGLPRDKFLPPIGLAPAFRRSVPEIAEPLSPKRLTAVYFVGCSGDLVYQEVAFATWRLLRKLGCRVVVPRDLVCCGTPVLNTGDFEGARALASKNLEILSQIKADVIVTACGSCGLTIAREWQELLGLDLPQRFSEKVVDISSLAIDLVKGDLGSRKTKATYHDPCHLRHGMKVYEEPRELLRSIDGLNLVEMPSPEKCCGGGGAYSIYHPDLSREIGRAKADSIAETGAEMVVTGCPACMMQLDESLKLAGANIRVAHTAQVIDRAVADPKSS